MSQLFGYIIESEKHKSRAVLWIKTHVKGSMPRKAVYQMLVLPNGEVFGTPDDQHLKPHLIETSKMMLQENYPHLYRINVSNYHLNH